MRRVIIESPYAGEIERNVLYAQRALRDSLRRGEAPFASHLLYTQALNDSIPEERLLGIEAGYMWGRVASYAVFYVDYGYSHGMLAAKNFWIAETLRFEERLIGKNNPDR